ncbi:MAG: Mov34/MPN/PAD-1 family protein [Gammaproteobacteria bacterium]|nr:Mov34/MPN/PAD-1 family protein [Gammaproteobacteria bacterium]
MLFSPNIENSARKHALACWPEESCGVVVNNTYEPKKNIAVDPLKNFKIADYPREGLQAVIHSHPSNHASPSKYDMQSQIQTSVPWGIIATSEMNAKEIEWFGDQIKDRPALLGRDFLHGIRDCFELVRDYYRLNNNLNIDQFPRDDEWWHKGDDILNPNNFTKYGFEIVSLEEVRPGDAALMMIGASVVNHCSIILEGGLIIHHLYNRLSRREPIGPWMRYVRYIVRPRN